MTWEQMSPAAARCCRVLWDAGFEAYPVGGCVRDVLLGRTPGDWDVTTSAMPEQVIALFDRVIPTGLAHGTVTVLLEGEQVEVTTFRREGGYADGRHPDEVSFDVDLEEDLARRDFTINAMALDRDGSVIDPFGGWDDLAQFQIRCVGEADDRFSEDALRMFRAVRFAAQLNFDLRAEVCTAIQRCAPGAAGLAAERVRVEVEKTLCSDRPDYVELLFEWDLMSVWTPARPDREMVLRLAALPAQPLYRWAGLCAALALEDTGAFLRTLRLEGRLVRACAAGARMRSAGMPREERDWRRALAGYGPEGCRAAAAMAEAGGEAGALEGLERVLEQKPCVSVGQLALSGGDLSRLGLEGAAIGAAQKRLLDHVLDRPEDNRADRLLELLRC